MPKLISRKIWIAGFLFPHCVLKLTFQEFYVFHIFRNKTSVLDALTWHHYYLDGHTAKLQDFLSVQRLDYFAKMMNTIQRFLDENGIKKPIWLGETSSAYGGGAHGLSDRYGTVA